MTKSTCLFLLFSVSFLACHSGNTSSETTHSKIIVEKVDPVIPIQQVQIDTILKDRFITPVGYERMVSDSGSWAWYLQNLPLKDEDEFVSYYDGSRKRTSGIYEAVVDMDLDPVDLQQCADAVIRLRGEYLYKYQPQHDISFNFTNGFPALWNKWKEGYRIQVSGNRCNWVKSSKADDSYEQFRKYLLDVFMYAGTLSLDKELPTKNIMDLAIGDVFIQGGSPGHAVIVVDMAVNEGGKKVYLLAQSYMPAQDTQVLTNPMDDYLSPWYELTAGTIYTPEWTFEDTDLHGWQ